MSWIQFFNELLIALVDFWKSLNLWGEVLLIWIIGALLINVIIPVLKYISHGLFHSKKQKKILSYCNRNLKPCCLFLDHATGAYVLSESTIVVEDNKRFYLSDNLVSRIPFTGINNP